jgi:hypothetical protein
MTETILTHQVIVRAPEAVSAEIAGETVILEMASGKYYALDPIGTLIWQTLESPCSLNDICSRLLDAYQVDRETCLRDVLALVSEMADSGLVQLETCGAD